MYDFPSGSVVKDLPVNAGDSGSIPGLGRCPGEGNGNHLQYSCVDNLINRGTWRVTVHGVAKESDTTEQLTHTHTHTHTHTLLCGLPRWFNAGDYLSMLKTQKMQV